MSRNNDNTDDAKRRFTSAAMPCIGALVLLSGFGYDIVFAGIPYQDPTPDLQARYAFHRSIAGWLYKTGASLVVAGVMVRPLMRKGTQSNNNHCDLNNNS